MIYTVDRIEEGFVLLEGEDGAVTPISAGDLPTGLHEGAKLEKGAAGWALRPDLEQSARNAMQARLERLKKRNLR